MHASSMHDIIDADSAIVIITIIIIMCNGAS
jgi:hypothetical protein